MIRETLAMAGQRQQIGLSIKIPLQRYLANRTRNPVSCPSHHAQVTMLESPCSSHHARVTQITGNTDRHPALHSLFRGSGNRTIIHPSPGKPSHESVKQSQRISGPSQSWRSALGRPNLSFARRKQACQLSHQYPTSLRQSSRSSEPSACLALDAPHHPQGRAH